MSARVESPEPVEIGAPLLTTLKWAAAPVPTSRDTNTCLWAPTLSSQIAHGDVGLAGFIVPAAILGSSASLPAFLFSEHWPSAVADSAHAPRWLVAPLVSSVPCSWLPTATQWKPPLAPTPSLIPLA